jgi:hypothetical protein
VKNLYTSYYARSGKDPKAICISVKAPWFYKGKANYDLAPSWELLAAYKAGQVDERGYTEWFLRLLKERGLTPQAVVDALEDGAIMLCYESSEKFCHRHIVAHWIEKGTGVKVEEIPATPKNGKPRETFVVDDLLEF